MYGLKPVPFNTSEYVSSGATEVAPLSKQLALALVLSHPSRKAAKDGAPGTRLP
jgi:hypothetical protein